MVFCTNRGHLDLFRHNPHVDVLRAARFWSAPLDYLVFLAKPRLFASTLYGDYSPGLAGKHAAQALVELMNLKTDDRQLEVFLTNEEESEADRMTQGMINPVALHVTSACSQNQNWPTGNWETLVRANSNFTFLQLGTSGEIRIPATIDLRGRTTVRQALAILKKVKAFVGVVSFLAHATNAVGTPGVVLFGPSTPSVWGHANNINLTLDLPCSPCIDVLHGTPCPYGAPCMSGLSVEQVSEALRKQVARCS
jgi:ADP-heptose:LPS heptosyltransferase